MMPSVMVGISQGYVTAPGRPNHNQPVFIKTALWDDALTQGYVTAPGRPNHNQPVFIKTAEQ